MLFLKFIFDTHDRPEPCTVVDDDGLAPAHGQSQAIECTEKDSDHTESVCSDNNSRPSRASAVDPVKSRIVDSTFNKVQDKTFSNYAYPPVWSYYLASFRLL